MALIREGHEVFERPVNVRNHTIGGVYAIGSDVASDLVKGGFGLGVKIVAGHEPDFALRASLFSRRRANTSSPGMSFTVPLCRCAPVPLLMSS